MFAVSFIVKHIRRMRPGGNVELSRSLPVESGHATLLAHQYVHQPEVPMSVAVQSFYWGFIANACLIKSLAM